MTLSRHCYQSFLFLVLSTGLLPGMALANYCVGKDCGAQMPGWHCHSVNALGVECWDASDNMCNTVAGFSPDQVRSCGATDTSNPIGIAGGVATQIPTVGGFNVFRGQVKKTAVPRMAERSTDDDTTQDTEDKESLTAILLSDISTNVENEQWDFFGNKGETNGLSLAWQRQTETGRILGFNASYQEATPDFGPSIEMINGSFNFGHTLGNSDTWKWSINATVTDISGVFDETLLGGGGQIYFNKYYDNGAVLSGGIIAQFQAADNLGDDLKTIGYGVAYGLPIGQRFALDFEGYGVSILDSNLDDDTFFTLGSMFSIYFTPRFTLTLGYRVLEGIDSLDSDTITLGSSTRW